MGDTQKDPLKESEFYFKQGESQRADGNLDVAISCYEECIRIGHPVFSSTSLLRLVAIYRQTGQKEKEFATLRRVTELPEKDKKFVPGSTLALVLEKLGRFDESVPYYEVALTLKPNDLSTILNFAELEIIRGQYDKASELFRRVKDTPDRKASLIAGFFFFLIAVLEKRDNAVTLALMNFIEVVKRVSVPEDFQWDFSDIAVVLPRITDENNSLITRKLISLLEHKVQVADFLKEFSGVRIAETSVG